MHPHPREVQVSETNSPNTVFFFVFFFLMFDGASLNFDGLGISVLRNKYFRSLPLNPLSLLLLFFFGGVALGETCYRERAICSLDTSFSCFDRFLFSHVKLGFWALSGPAPHRRLALCPKPPEGSHTHRRSRAWRAGQTGQSAGAVSPKQD